MKITCVSDLHGFYPKLSGGDLLIVAGDLTKMDRQAEYLEFRDWLRSTDYRQRILVGGNHDNCIENGRFYFSSDWLRAIYLQDGGFVFEGVKIWGSPWTKRFDGMNPHCMAFTVPNEKDLEEKWNWIPNDCHILVTHSPAKGFGDEVTSIYMDENGNEKTLKENCGSRSLTKWIAAHSDWLKLHVCGHIHEGYGLYSNQKEGKKCAKAPLMVNASHVNFRYEPVNKPIDLEISV